ncbi:MAG: glycosyltransferase family 39 protein [Deltaproteobacteria bacterium]|nr:glycosyltransferase family 39 protein [Deltaproteobacteria bacterium]
MFFVFSTSDSALPFTGFYQGDAETFFRYARAILGGQVYDSGIPFHPPGFPYVLAGVQSLLGAGEATAQVPHLAVKLALALVSSCSVGLIYLLVRPYLGKTVALVTSLLCLYHFGLYVIAIAPVSEGVFLSLLLASLWVWTRKLSHPLSAWGSLAGKVQNLPQREAAWGFTLGVMLGLLALTRAESALLTASLWGIGLTGWLLRARTGEATARTLTPWILVALGVALTLAPWTLRNSRSLEATNQSLGAAMVEPLPTFVPLTLYGPLNLALANHSAAEGTFSRDLMSSQSQSGTLQLTDPQHLSFLLHGDEMAWSYIRANPREWLGLVGTKWRLVLETTKLGWSQWNWPGGLTGLRRPIDIFVPYSRAASMLQIPLLLLGLILCLWKPGPERRWGAIVLLVSGCTFLVTALFFGYVRQGVLLTPLWASLLGFGLVSLARAGRRWVKPTSSPSRRWLQLAAAGILALFLLEAWGATQSRKFEATGTTLPGRTYLNPDLTIYLKPLG